MQQREECFKLFWTHRNRHLPTRPLLVCTLHLLASSRSRCRVNASDIAVPSHASDGSLTRLRKRSRRPARRARRAPGSTQREPTISAFASSANPGFSVAPILDARCRARPAAQVNLCQNDIHSLPVRTAPQASSRRSHANRTVTCASPATRNPGPNKLRARHVHQASSEMIPPCTSAASARKVTCRGKAGRPRACPASPEISTTNSERLRASSVRSVYSWTLSRAQSAANAQRGETRPCRGSRCARPAPQAREKISAACLRTRPRSCAKRANQARKRPTHCTPASFALPGGHRKTKTKCPARSAASANSQTVVPRPA